MTILTEKENVAKNYAQALSLKKTKPGLYTNTEGTIKLTYAAGHLYTLYDMKDYNAELEKWTNIKLLPYIPKTYKTKADNGFKNTKKQTRINCENILREAITKKDEIVIATDPDREGEVIARFILDKLKADYSRVSRVWCCEGVNKEEVLKGLSGRKKASDYNLLYIKGIKQKESDWVIGTNLTRLFTLIQKDGSLWSIGRVQTAVLQELYDRNMEISLFIKKKHYELKIETEEGVTFYYDRECNSNNLIYEKAVVEEVNKEVMNMQSIVITSLTSEKKIREVPQLFDSAELGSEAYNLYGYPVDKTLEISQKLYCERGITSYPRTSSVYLKEEDFEAINERYKDFTKHYLKKEKELTREDKRIFNTKKCTGHHAIIPTRKAEELTEEEEKIYSLILNRFLMQALGKNVTEVTKAFGNCGKYVVKCEGKKTVEKGWREIDLHREEEGTEIKVEKGQIFHVKKTQVIEKETQPPKHYTQASLIKFMKNPGGKDEEGDEILSIGTQATQANIIKTLFDRKYIVEVKKHIEITERGIKLIEKVRDIKSLDKNTRVTATTMWEKLNEKDPDKFLSYIEKVTKDIFVEMEDELKVSVQKSRAGVCPACGGNLLEGKNGWYCSNYKEKGCDNNLTYHMMGIDITKEVIEKLLSEKKSEIFKGVKKDGNSVSFYIEVDDKGKFKIVYINEQVKICSCPKCKNDVREYLKVYKCTNKECDFFLWKKTSGIEFEKEDIADLCSGAQIIKEMTKKDGSLCNVNVQLSKDYSDLKIKYINK